jgi:hypothetical protein
VDKDSMAGWIAFAAFMMMIMGGLIAIEGLIAILDDNYYVVGQTILFNDLTGWGFIMLIWGCVVAFAGYSLLAGAEWSRWFAIFVVCANFLAQLSFDARGSTLWALVVMTLDIIVLYALIARWEASKTEMA